MSYKPPQRKLAWLVLFSFTGFVDLVQIIIDMTGIGIAVSEGIEMVMPAIVIGLLMLFKIPIFNKINRLASILGVDLGDALTGGLVPFWIGDIWYLYWDVNREEKALQAQVEQQEFQESALARPLNNGGVRQPPEESTGLKPDPNSNNTLPSESGKRNQDTKPLNLGGIRRPQKRV